MAFLKNKIMAILGICCKKDSQCGTNARDTFTQASK